MKDRLTCRLNSALSQKLAVCATLDDALRAIQIFTIEHRKYIDDTSHCFAAGEATRFQGLAIGFHAEDTLIADLVREGFIDATSETRSTLKTYLKQRRRLTLLETGLASWADALDAIDAGSSYTLLASVVFPLDD